MAPALAHANCLQFTPPNPQPTLSASWTGALGAMNAAAQGEGENLNTPNFAGGIGAFRAALKESPSTSRVWTGSITPSSQRRAVA